MDDLWDDLVVLWDEPAIRTAVIILGSLIAAKLIQVIIHHTVGRLVRHTTTDLDDRIVNVTRQPVFYTVILIGLGLAIEQLPVTSSQVRLFEAVLVTLGILLWSTAAFRVSVTLLEALSQRERATGLVQPRTLPVFEMVVKLAVVGTTIYFLFLAWQIDLTAWLASAGIIGIAVGFAAKDTLANLFAGIFIVADAPYKVSDFIVLDGGLRGQVTKIGIRSTRILTRDDVEITIPNAVIGSSKIVNETGGPYTMQRAAASVEVAYDSDIDKVREVLLTCPTGVEWVATEPAPQVRFREFCGSGLRFELLVWVTDPAMRGRVLDTLHCAIFKAFRAAHVEIPYSKHDVFIKQLPATTPSSRPSSSPLPSSAPLS